MHGSGSAIGKNDRSRSSQNAALTIASAASP
jgi:hypothetical protein